MSHTHRPTVTHMSVFCILTAAALFQHLAGVGLRQLALVNSTLDEMADTTRHGFWHPLLCSALQVIAMSHQSEAVRSTGGHGGHTGAVGY